MVTGNQEWATLNFVEITGAAISAGRENVKDIEVSMALYGLQALAPNHTQTTATERVINNSSTNSSLASWALDYQDVIIEVYNLYAEFMSTTFTGEIAINTEYDLGYADPTAINAILQANSQGIISNENTYNELQKRGIINTDETFEENSVAIEKEIQSPFNTDTLFNE